MPGVGCRVPGTIESVNDDAGGNAAGGNAAGSNNDAGGSNIDPGKRMSSLAAWSCGRI